jgi:DNA-binding XRE family transcriptional regulator
MKLVEEPRFDKYKSKLKRQRIYRGFTQETLADLSNVNIKSIAAYEQNPEKLSAASTATVYKLADSLGCNIEDLINKENIRRD